MKTGLNDAASEHDACGVGMVVNIRGDKTHELVDNALTVLENMSHRGAVALEWDVSFRGRNDPSGRAVAGIHAKAY